MWNYTITIDNQVLYWFRFNASRYFVKLRCFFPHLKFICAVRTPEAGNGARIIWSELPYSTEDHVVRTILNVQVAYIRPEWLSAYIAIRDNNEYITSKIYHFNGTEIWSNGMFVCVFSVNVFFLNSDLTKLHVSKSNIHNLNFDNLWTFLFPQFYSIIQK